MLDPRKILIACPCHDGRLMSETAGSIMAVGGKYASITMPSEISNVSLVRNMIASNFMQSQFEWLFCVDSDIAFSRTDWAYLAEATDQPSVDIDHPEPTREAVPQVIGRDHTNGEFLTAVSAADVLVCAEYPYKDDTLIPIKLGMGFVRIHRSVFERLQKLDHDDGQPRLWQTLHRGVVLYDYFPSGPIFGQHVPTAEWKGEDHGFFTLCMLAGIIPRIETRTRLTHIGRKGYHYNPNASGAQ